ncbi:MFS transporter [Lasiodiplodia theobromae]|uniref:Uncharacterized protein n=1 Tax=Lasiodiplodia theobromae TaxID=45133 RepID=A0A5N5CTR2_9PEZI|nr:MFS transporter [Lasiodiplodia theobromae]KAB2568711.1 hypothetical protein DBV05_g12614 [Lasiodiplodia theobromae]KAF4538614.1 MFS transporter [Lasiodiplodia theobromae]
MSGHAMDQHRAWSQSALHHGEPSQEDDLNGMVDKMLESTRDRREARRTSLGSQHHTRRADTEERVDKSFDDHGMQALQLRNAQTARLIELLRRQDEIEHCMAASVKLLERAFLSQSVELRTALGSRMAELQ